MSEIALPVTPGPCQPWCSVEDVAACCDAAVGTNTSVYEAAADAASYLLWSLSGSQFNGICEQTVRPCVESCGCWSWIVSPASPGVPQLPFGYTWGWWGLGVGWGWGYEGCSEVCGCGSISRALLPGYPVQAVSEVIIDGSVINPDSYRLDGWRWLTRLADPAAPDVEVFWPACQRLDLPLTEAGTWGVTYTFGTPPPELGVQAAAQLACDIYKSCSAGECKIPPGTTRVTRQGIQVELAPFRAWAQVNGQWATGLPLVDMFLSAANPAGMTRPATVWSPDMPEFAQRLGTGSGD